MEKNFNVSTPHFFPVISGALTKALRQDSGSTKALKQNDAPANPQLTAWYEQAYAYYNAVVSGAEAKPDPKAWQGLLDQMQWAKGELGYGQSNWSPMSGSQQGSGPQGHQQQLPTGAIVGPMGNLVWNSDKADINCNGGDQVNDIWSNEVNLNVASLSAKVSSELTQDTRLHPPEEVLKIVVTDPATQAETVYFVHDYQDAKIKIRTSVQKQVSDNTDSAGIDLVSWEQFKAGSAGDPAAKPDSSVPGKVEADGSITYEPDFSGGTIDFWANPGENQKHVVYSDANLSVKPSDQVVVTKNPSTGTITAEVKHKDGSTDTYLIQKGYKLNVNCNAEYITLAGQAGSEGVPEDLKDRVTLNGSAGKTDSKTEPAKDGTDSDAIVAALLKATGRSEAQLLSALNGGNYKYADLASFKEAIKAGTFPGKATDQLVKFLQVLDPDLAKAVKAVQDLGFSNDPKRKTLNDAVQSRLVTLLQGLLPNDIVQGTTASSSKVAGSFTINGTRYDWDTTGADGLILTND